jgi:pyruvate-formate lyase-activating enzyme
MVLSNNNCTARSWRTLRRAQALKLYATISASNYFQHVVRGHDLLRPVYAIYELTHACNLSCSYCDDGTGSPYRWSAAGSHPLPLDDVLRLLHRLRHEVPGIYLSGGEPTLHPHFLEILREVDHLGFLPIMLSTNGLRLAGILERDPELFQRVDILFLSLDARKPRTLERLFRSKPGNGMRVLEALELCLNVAAPSGCSLVISCVVTRDTIADAIDVARLCRERNILFAPVPANKGKGLSDSFADCIEYQALVDEILGPKGPRLVGDSEIFRILMRFLPFQCHPAVRIHVTPEGCIPWPCQSDARFALPLLDYGSVSSLMTAAEARHSVERQGQRCGSACYLAQNVSTHLYVTQPFSLTRNVVLDFILRPNRIRTLEARPVSATSLGGDNESECMNAPTT